MRCHIGRKLNHARISHSSTHVGGGGRGYPDPSDGAAEVVRSTKLKLSFVFECTLAESEQGYKLFSSYWNVLAAELENLGSCGDRNNSAALERVGGCREKIYFT